MAGARERQALMELLTARGAAFGFECRLAAGAERLDFGVLTRLPDGPDLLLELSHRAGHGWSGIERFSRCWGDPTSALNLRVPFVFLEFDGDVEGGSLPLPSLFASLDWPDGVPAAEADVELIHGALALLVGDPLPRATLERVASCCEALPGGGRTLHAGLMLGRRPAPVRLSLSLPRGGLASYLERIEWRGPVCEIERALDELVPPLARVHLELDVGAEVGDRLGCVVAFGTSEPLAQWRELLARLVARGLCAPEKRDAFLEWPAVGAEGAYVDGAFVPIRRDWSHVKLTFSPGAPPEAKAYLTARALV